MGTSVSNYSTVKRAIVIACEDLAEPGEVRIRFEGEDPITVESFDGEEKAIEWLVLQLHKKKRNHLYIHGLFSELLEQVTPK